MKTVRLFLSILLILGISNKLFSQNIIYTNDDIKDIEGLSTAKEQTEKIEKVSKITYNVEVGTSFSTSKNFGNLLSFYTSPSLRYRLSPKLSVTAGALLVNTNLNQTNKSDIQYNKFNQIYLTTGFDYTKERLRISGEILYGLNNSQYNKLNQKNRPDYYARFSAEYKITNNFSIGIQVINQSMNQNYFDPYGYQIYNPYNRTYSGF